MDTQEFKYRLYLLRGPLAVLALLMLLAAMVYLFSPHDVEVPQATTTDASLAEKIRTGEAPIPEMTEVTKVKLEKGPVFHALASYTDRGFEPSVLTIKRGETVRFTNNSSNDVWIAADGSAVQIYPRTKSVCGSSDLDSCEPFAPMDFWQFRFDIAGEWEVVNNLDKSMSGEVIVQ